MLTWRWQDKKTDRYCRRSLEDVDEVFSRFLRSAKPDSERKTVTNDLIPYISLHEGRVVPILDRTCEACGSLNCNQLA